MNRQDFVKGQTCVLKVNIHCDGCKQKVRKLLKKIDGVYDTSIDVERGMVTVKGSVDPATLIRKLEKSGKHAQLWGPQKGSNNFPNQLNNQFKNMQMDFGKGGKDNKPQKGGGNNNMMPKGGQQFPQQQQQLMKGHNNNNNMMMMQGNNQKSAKFSMHEDDHDDSDDDEFDDDEYDDDFSDNDFDDHRHNLPPNKMMQAKGGGGGYGGLNNKMNGFAMNDKKGYGGAMDGKKGGVVDIPVGMKGGKDGKHGYGGGGGGGGSKKGYGGNDKGSKNGYGGKDKKKGGGGVFLGLVGLLGGKSKKKDKSKNEYGYKYDSTMGGNHGGKNKGNGGKGGSKKDAFLGMDDMDNDFHGMDIPQHGKGKGKGKGGGNGNGNGGGKNPMGQMGGNPMGQMGNYSAGQMGNYPMGQIPAVQGLPASAAMNGGGFHQGPGMNMGQGNPYNQQYMPPPMMMNQQRPNGYDTYQPMMYARPQPSVNYMHPMAHPAPDPYADYFSDENPTGCSIM